MSDVFKALADPTRRQMLLLLSQQPSSVNELVQHFDLSRPAISKHLKVLTSHELVRITTDSQDGRQRRCYAQLEGLQSVRHYLDALEQFWADRLDALGDLVEGDALDEGAQKPK